MKERIPEIPTPEESLAIIHTEMVKSNKAIQFGGIDYEDRRIRSKELYKQFAQILKDSGKERSKNVVKRTVGSGTVYTKTESYLETPSVAIEFEAENAKLVLSKVLSSHSEYNVIKDSILLTARFDEDSGPQQLFLINEDGETQNWLRRPATLKEMNMIGRVLDLVKQSLPINSDNL